ncbi:DeoR/GlpR family DNA-binding transcription regulator [Aureimonas jatrophae]|uniref:Transcriptional regulator, DeoR family n=1 Tax=Aureimonas jatrophae TaxID=1166073 RepID=A0A1H0L8H5_9HYPH|nr:DeoR/GlpR family DNA-binding transcription regulator [Aureimonas jatrophae]MBB3952455.1 DeoR family ulaG and ulaABCDEF operon transcriptional repressor [Aureimonas jatrophae]SDO64554.1 transcriptional regulator, DeoR family [Aureimonas jatrophae]
MHELERHRLILSAVQGRSVVAVPELVEMTGASEATIRRDIAALALTKRLRRVRGGAEALNASPYGRIGGPSILASEARRRSEKRAIAQAAAQMCVEGDSIIINGGTTTFQMVHALGERQIQVFTNSFLVAEHLVKHSRCTVLLPAGAVYREQGLVLSPFEADGIAHFAAQRMFMGAQAISALGIAEGDPLIVQSEQRLMRQADELVVLADSTKFRARSSLVVARLERVSAIVTDEGIEDAAAQMVENAGVRLVVARAPGAGSQAATA